MIPQALRQYNNHNDNFPLYTPLSTSQSSFRDTCRLNRDMRNVRRLLTAAQNQLQNQPSPWGWQQVCFCRIPGNHETIEYLQTIELRYDHILFLRNPGSGLSPHTQAEVMVLAPKTLSGKVKERVSKMARKSDNDGRHQIAQHIIIKEKKRVRCSTYLIVACRSLCHKDCIRKLPLEKLCKALILT